MLLRKQDEDRIPKVIAAVHDAGSWEDLERRLSGIDATGLIRTEPDDDEPYTPEAVTPEFGLSVELMMTMVLRANIPREIEEEFAERVGSPIAGAWPEYPTSRLDELRDALTHHGFVLDVVRLEGDMPAWM